MRRNKLQRSLTLIKSTTTTAKNNKTQQNKIPSKQKLSTHRLAVTDFLFTLLIASAHCPIRGRTDRASRENPLPGARVLKKGVDRPNSITLSIVFSLPSWTRAKCKLNFKHKGLRYDTGFPSLLLE